MGTIKMTEIRKLDVNARAKRLAKYREELREKYAQLSAGGSIDDSGKITELRRTIARFLTVENELKS